MRAMLICRVDAPPQPAQRGGGDPAPIEGQWHWSLAPAKSVPAAGDALLDGSRRHGDDAQHELGPGPDLQMPAAASFRHVSGTTASPGD